jgi:iron complex outermembrane receptor protein
MGLSRLGSVACAPLIALLVSDPAFGQSDDAPAAADRVVVTGRAQSLYRVDEVSSGKLPTPPLLSTQTVQVINAQMIEDQGARDAQDLYRNLSGVSFFSYAGVTARGFRQEEIFFDGLRGDPYASFSVPQLFNIERVEFLKGPAGMLYGPGAPGGIFNYITKTPGDQFGARASAVTGTEARYGASAEIEGPLNRNVAGRAGVFYETRNLPRKNADSTSQIYDGSLRFELDRGEITLQAARYDQDLGGARLRGVPADNFGQFLADRRWNANEDSDFLRLESNVLQAKADYALTDSLTVDAGVRWNENQEAQQYHEPSGLFDSDGDGQIDSSRRQFRDQFRTNESWSFGANAIWTAQVGGIDNRLLAGGDWFTVDSSFDNTSIDGGRTAVTGLPTPLSLTGPQYGVTDSTTYNLPPKTPGLTEQERKGFYLLNEATLGRFIAVAGVRRDSFDDRNVTAGTGFEDSATTWRAGLVYRLRDDVSLFGQWAESFEPQGIANQDPRAGGPFAPSAGEIFEGGVRTELMNGRIQSSASVYRIVRSNLLQADPLGDAGGDGVNDQIAIGEVTSEGFELDIAADVTPDWVATVSYAYNDAVITGTAGTSTLSNAVGDKFANAPEHTLGFWTRYQFPAINTAIAFGGDYVDVRRSIDGQKVRPYMVFDAS